MIGQLIALIVLACNNSGLCEEVPLSSWETLEDCEEIIFQQRIFNGECRAMNNLAQLSQPANNTQ